MTGLQCIAAVAVVVAVTLGRGSSQVASWPAVTTSSLPTDVQLAVSTKATGGKALVFNAALAQALVGAKGHLYEMQL